MKVILQKHVQSLGKAGDVVEAAPGYFRNYLQPRGLAVMATGGALKKREEDIEAIRKKAEQQHQTWVELSEKINSIGTLRMFSKVGEGGRLYGKITNKEIALEITKALQLQTELDKRMVKTAEDIGSLGTYKAIVKLAPEVQAEVMVEVQPEGWTPPPPKPVVSEEPAEEQELVEAGAE